MDKKTDLFNFNHVREPAQREQMEKLQAAGICLLCPEHITTYHREPIEQDSDWWMVTKNDFPYKGTKVHYLFVYKPHTANVANITPEAWADLGAQITLLQKRLQIPGGAFFMRFGDTDYNGSSITHLHAHVISGVPHDEAGDKIEVKLGYKK
ncbi:HIT domain-containing protein [Candidatus Kaiserbacteria bacterium]|nr:HIT domain-containing protein [Candidatus Kaiserbacteria bacterium]